MCIRDSALRFEMARELCRLLKDDFNLELQPAIGTMPTITEIGMAALLPKAHESAKVVAVGGGKGGGLDVGKVTIQAEVVIGLKKGRALLVRWIFRMLWIGVVGWLVYGVVDGYQRGYFSIPDMPEGSYLFSIKSGFRGIVLDAKVSEPSSPDTPKVWRQIAFANPERRYIALPFEVGPYVVDAWSTCTAPTDEELAYFRCV